MVNKPPIWDILSEINANPLREKGLGWGGLGHVEMTVNEHSYLVLPWPVFCIEMKLKCIFFFCSYFCTVGDSYQVRIPSLKARKTAFLLSLSVFFLKSFFKPSWRRKTWIRPLLCFSLFCVQVRVGFEPTTADKTNKMKLQYKQLKCPIPREKSWKFALTTWPRDQSQWNVFLVTFHPGMYSTSL